MVVSSLELVRHSDVDAINGLGNQKSESSEENIFARAKLDSVFLTFDSMVPEFFFSFPKWESMDKVRCPSCCL